ncbi:hypothetical protein N0V93_003189 [Gnomoniopsis smithogilvyi]|uniref:Uncharacterized protein n=1 Tax=Gnomoniopsis smithogilvyi TaxID=1191159 RepID=A0A9W9CZM8_9PEZI|nr:hypothetical protein N0V93_003189 [Gnomoniopsis smithogilvyi]
MVFGQVSGDLHDPRTDVGDETISGLLPGLCVVHVADRSDLETLNFRLSNGLAIFVTNRQHIDDPAMKRKGHEDVVEAD